MKVIRSALQNAAMILSTKTLISNKPEEKNGHRPADVPDWDEGLDF